MMGNLLRYFKKKKPINPSLALPGAHTFKQRTRMECPVHLKCTGLLCILLWHPVLLPGLSTHRHRSLCIIKHKQAKTLSTVVQYVFTDLLLWFYSFSIFSIEHIDWHLSSTSLPPANSLLFSPGGNVWCEKDSLKGRLKILMSRYFQDWNDCLYIQSLYIYCLI